MPLNPQDTYVHLADTGTAQEVSPDTLWKLPSPELAGYGHGWLISEYEFTEDWPTWEMHPGGDEFVYLLSGAVELHMEQDGQVLRVALERRGALLVPRGVWHTAKVLRPSRMLHVTRGAGTRTRPTQPAL